MSFGKKLQHRIFQGLCGTVTSESKVNYGHVAFHRSKVVRVITANSSTIHHTPPYCPWFNPVEHAFSSCKAAFRYKRVQREPGAGFLKMMSYRACTVTPEMCRLLRSQARVLVSHHSRNSGDGDTHKRLCVMVSSEQVPSWHSDQWTLWKMWPMPLRCSLTMTPMRSSPPSR
jgi:hypothetical protein